MSIASSIERTGNRDISYSTHHRILGKTLYATDIDMFEFKYVNNEPEEVAIFDYKEWHKSEIKLSEPSIRFQKNLANKLNIPFFIIVYQIEGGFGTYFINPINEHATNFLLSIDKGKGWYSDRTFSKLLSNLRHEEYDFDVDKLSSEVVKWKTPKFIY